MEAHLGKKIKISKGTYDEFKDQVLALWPKDPKAIKSMGSFITDHTPTGSTLPFGKVDRITKYWNVVTGLS